MNQALIGLLLGSLLGNWFLYETTQDQAALIATQEQEGHRLEEKIEQQNLAIQQFNKVARQLEHKARVAALQQLQLDTKRLEGIAQIPPGPEGVNRWLSGQ